jgi:transcription elongation factor Elf1
MGDRNISLDGAIERFYQLKQKYENKINKKKNDIKERYKSVKKVRDEFKKIKTECVYCNRNVGSSFTVNKKTYKAQCGDDISPCSFNIEIEKGMMIPYETRVYGNSQRVGSMTRMQEIEKKIMDTKLNMLFSFTSEEESLDEFEKQKKALAEFQDEHLMMEGVYMDVTVPDESLEVDELSKRKQEIIEKMRETKKIANENNDQVMLGKMMDMYVNEYVPLAYEIMTKQYLFNVVESEEIAIANDKKPDPKTVKYHQLFQDKYRYHQTELNFRRGKVVQFIVK